MYTLLVITITVVTSTCSSRISVSHHLSSFLVQLQTMQNLFKSIPTSLPEEMVDVLAKSGRCRIERIVSRGHTSEPKDFMYDQEETEWVMVVSGSARLSFEDGRELVMSAGDHVTIMPHEKHRVDYTSTEEDTIWLAVFW